MKQALLILFGLEDPIKLKSFIESVKEAGRWIFSIIASILLTQLVVAITTALNNGTIPTFDPISFWGISYDIPVRPLVELVLLPIAIRMADKFKFVKQKEAAKEEIVHMEQDMIDPLFPTDYVDTSQIKSPSGVIPF